MRNDDNRLPTEALPLTTLTGGRRRFCQNLPRRGTYRSHGQLLEAHIRQPNERGCALLLRDANGVSQGLGRVVGASGELQYLPHVDEQVRQRKELLRLAEGGDCLARECDRVFRRATPHEQACG